MTTQLMQMTNNIISAEELLSLMEAHEMNQAHVAALQGFKRFHRYRAMDRGRHSLKLQCFMAENYHTEPAITLAYQTPASGLSFVDSLKRMHDLSVAHLKMLKESSTAAFDEGEHLLGGYLEMMIVDQAKEVDEYYRLWCDVKRENADLNYLSKELHKKMKCMEKKYFGFRSDKAYKY